MYVKELSEHMKFLLSVSPRKEMRQRKNGVVDPKGPLDCCNYLVSSIPVTVQDFSFPSVVFHFLTRLDLLNAQ